MTVLWHGYLDESETGTGASRVFTVACLLAPSLVWDRFSADWMEALRSCGADHKILHMRSTLAGRGEWTGWTEPMRHVLFEKLVAVVRSYPIAGYCGSIPMVAHERLYAITDEKDGPITPYQLVLQGTLEKFVEDTNDFPDEIRPSSQNRVVLHMEESPIEAEITHQFFHLIKSRPGWESIFGDILPAPKGPAPLQAADMIAYEGSTHASRHEVGPKNGRSAREPRKLYRELKGHINFRTAPTSLLRGHIGNLLAAAKHLDSEQERAINARYSSARDRTQQARDPAYKKPARGRQGD